MKELRHAKDLRLFDWVLREGLRAQVQGLALVGGNSVQVTAATGSSTLRFVVRPLDRVEVEL